MGSKLDPPKKVEFTKGKNIPFTLFEAILCFYLFFTQKC